MMTLSMRKVAILLLLTLLALPAPAFTSLYVFGDSASSVTYGLGDSRFYNGRSCNGRIWTEVLAQRQGIAFEANKTIAFFGHYSAQLVTNVASYPAPADAATALFVVWVNNADFVGMTFDNSPPYVSNAVTLSFWTNRMNQSLNNHSNAIQSLYNKGARTMLMPNSVDLGLTPYFNATDAPSKNFLRQRTIQYNAAFAGLLNQAQATMPGLVIRSPDFFKLLDNVVSNAPAFGLTNVLKDGVISYALENPAVTNFNGVGTNYIFWDYLNPGAKAMAIMADLAHQSLTPTRMVGVTKLPGTNRLDAVNLPVGLGGFVEATTNFSTWSPVQSFASTNAVQGILVPQNGPQQFYRLRFPFVWSWP